ncbi:MAG: aldehyde dehydrogenase family protein [Bryobacterales bacterium]|nr:aldehyde dehydrogenase family protein [Bryobacterales bacterium]
MLHDPDLVSVQEVRTKVERAYAAFQEYRKFTQEQVDAVVESMAAAARGEARRLAELAVEETGYGNVESKVAKNLLCADLLPRRIRGMKTIGILREIKEERVIEIAEPVGVVAAILPTTNPTSTAIYKSIVALKAGNAVVLSPHPRAKGSTCATIDVLHRAAIAAGAPPELIQCINNATIEGTNALMRHPRTGVILSTGGSGIVRAAYSSGKPAFGVGPGNVPVCVEESADIAESMRKIVEGKSFDYGTVCSSEQTVVAVKPLRERILSELNARKAYLCTEKQGHALARVLLNEKLVVNADCVGQSPQRIAQMAGFSVPEDCTILAVEIRGVGKQHPLSAEKLSPVLALYFVDDFAACLDACEAVLRFGGLGHTCVIHSNDDARVLEYGRRMPAFRVLVNTSSPQGSTGITTNVMPSMTLGCGAIAGNITSDNVGPQHLYNIKRVAYAVRTPEEAFPSQAAAAMPDRAAVVSAVERYLAQKLGQAPVRAHAPVAAAPSAARRADSRTIATNVVDHFLGTRKQPAAPAPSTCSCALPKLTAMKAETAAVAAPAPPPTPPPPAAPPPLPIVDFVCESDVRAAMKESRKIYTGPKTIVTPAARELAAQYDILVQAKRS